MRGYLRGRVRGIKNHVLLAASTLLLFAPSAHALKFTNQFIEFELPPNWNCALEGAEWVCQSSNDQKKRDAIVVLAAKLKGDQDTLDKYQDYLNKPRAFTAPGGKSVNSQPKYSKGIDLNGQKWIDSIHLESEIPGFYTRYLATVKNDIGVLVTYSINKGKYQEYLTQFEDMVKSMKVFRKNNAPLNSKDTNLANNADMKMGNALFPTDTPTIAADAAAAPKSKKSDGDNTMLLIVGGAAVVGFILYKRKKSNG